ncbi:MAG TPA: molybdopterin-dependent oxidoreductase, partial [Actinomycetota bacterium]|nr:molybdopterin-dependent oxidoreductase [Actinomycetota bacterium]
MARTQPTDGSSMTGERTAFRTCPLCEATCGLELTLVDDHLVKVRGDDDDVFSHGYLCPKAFALIDLESDPDVVRTPLVREDDTFREATWDEAFARIEQGLRSVIDRDGPNAVAMYLGNPNVHNLSGSLYGRALLRALGTKNLFTASTVDQMPKQVSAGLMFGTGLSIPIPDIDRTDYLLILGANPYASNGSLFTAPDLPGRLRALKARGGTFVVVDPVRTQTAKQANEHHFIVPGSDAHFLFAVAHTLFDENLTNIGRLAEHSNGVDEVRALATDFTPEVVQDACGIRAEEIRRIARDLAAAPRAAVYARIGTCTQEFGTLASWLVDVVNVLIGALDAPGGVMFPLPAAGGPTTAGAPGIGRGISIGRHRSRVRGLPEVLNELPIACLAEEILTPGDGQIRALITIAGNPAVSAPNAREMNEALGSLDFMLAVDIYVNETTRHADVILPGESTLTRGHFDLAFYALACRNVANYSPPAKELPTGGMHEWELLLRVAGIAAGQGPDVSIDSLDELVARDVLRRGLQNPSSPAKGVDEETAWKEIAFRSGPERLLDILLRTGPYGEAFGRNPDGLTLGKLEENPHGIDLGPLMQRIPEVLRTPTGKIELAPQPIVDDVDRLRTSLARKRNGELVLIGRRQLRSNNSWMHNLPALSGGSNRCTMLVNPDDASRLGISEGARARVSSSAGTVEVDVEISESIMRGVVSIPHGWSGAEPGVRAQIATAAGGVNSNILAPSDSIDPL